MLHYYTSRRLHRPEGGGTGEEASMSFVDRKQDPHRRAHAIIAVGAIHAGLAYVVVTGLGAEIIEQLGSPPITATQIPLTPPPPPDPTPPKPTNPQDTTVVVPQTPFPPQPGPEIEVEIWDKNPGPTVTADP